jgi:hypothetical protein
MDVTVRGRAPSIVACFVDGGLGDGLADHGAATERLSALILAAE